MRLLTTALTAALLLIGADARADKPRNWTEGELALLPSYCRDTQGFAHTQSGPQRSPRAEHWIALMGETFWSMHHYCWGLMNLNRAQMAGVPRQQREFLIGTSIDDYQFVLRTLRPDFPLLPEVLTRIGQAHLLLKQYDAASAAFMRAREVKPDYWPPYVDWAEAQLQLGLTAGARQTMEAALNYLPDEPRVLALAQRSGMGAEAIAAAQRAARQRAAAASAPQAPEPPASAAQTAEPAASAPQPPESAASAASTP